MTGPGTECTEWRGVGQTRQVLLWSLLFGTAAVLLLNNLAGYRPLTTHEVLVAQTAREMRDSGQWLTPTYFGELRLRKPPLAYWQVMVCYQLLGGRSEWAARLPSVLAGLALVVILAALATRMFSSRVGLWAAFVQSTSVYWLLQARLAEIDITLALLLAVAIACYWLLVESCSRAKAVTGARRWPALGFWIAVSLAFLAKGPVGPIMIAVIVGAHAACRRCASALKTLLCPIYLLLALAIAGSWPLTMLALEPTAWQVWLKETAGRFLHDPNGVSRHAFYYPWAALWLTLPWSPVWLAWLWRRLTVRKACGWRDKETLLLCWLLAPMLLLSLSAGKQEHYLIPALAPCSVLAALALRQARQHWRRGSNAWSLASRRVVLASAAALVGIILVVQAFVLPLVHGRRQAADWTSEATDTLTPATPIVALGHSVQWLAFYVEQPMRRVDSLEAFLAERPPGPRWVLTTQGVSSDLQVHCEISGSLHPQSLAGDKKAPILLRVDRLKMSPVLGN